MNAAIADHEEAVKAHKKAEDIKNAADELA